ncbi:MAG: DedA family protein [Candidatus Hydrogenedentes bacterium]|nr:DedA family protein [Candidatus Hydrogenedentota bacterium]
MGGTEHRVLAEYPCRRTGGRVRQYPVVTIPGAIIASSLGTIIGSLIGYYMGRLGGYPLVHRFGRYLLLDPEHLEITVKWFEKHGDITIFVCRFVPVVRHLISIPAGVGSMNLLKFSFYTLIGGTIWNSILLFLGIKLGKHWDIIHHYSHVVDYFFVAGILIVGAWWFRRQWRRHTQKA